MIFETNEQALFLVPMAISLGLGTLASSVVVLVLVPVAFIVSEELKGMTSSDKEEAVPEEEPELEAVAACCDRKHKLETGRYVYLWEPIVTNWWFPMPCCEWLFFTWVEASRILAELACLEAS